jgi:beta-glucanase (GH16 family)
VDGTGTKFESRYAEAVYLFADEGATLEVSRLALIVEKDAIPSWLGKQPPVPQAEWKNWRQTFNENFDKPLDFKTWNIYTDNYWDRRTHFSKDNNIIKDGKMILRYEKRRGYMNDDPTEIWGDNGQSDYVCGFADTYGKWTQRYGYFECRMKLPRADGLWPCYWTMPDRGVEHGPEQWKRANTGDGGMEFDIMENLTGWGPYRFNQAFHWDGYGHEHKSVGSAWVYVRPDNEGYITIGLLWLPGLAVYYSNGIETGRMEGDRVCNVQSYPILYMVSGGWDNTWSNDAQLPVDFSIDYVRAWQRNDLATPEDGFKPNDGRPKMQSQSPAAN